MEFQNKLLPYKKGKTLNDSSADNELRLHSLYIMGMDYRIMKKYSHFLL